jgi:hypothetical protein
VAEAELAETLPWARIDFPTGHYVAQQDPDGFAPVVLEFGNG